MSGPFGVHRTDLDHGAVAGAAAEVESAPTWPEKTSASVLA
ncbi:MAG TPA: hypothetical protein VM686_33775 [Polyangiaceae bacterium]|nr:hypothetical protein [Polyangiaceae bacterium]